MTDRVPETSSPAPGAQPESGSPHARANPADVRAVRAFWEANPLWTGEAECEPGTLEFFEGQKRVIVEDGFAGAFDTRLYPAPEQRGRVLDLGCGPGFWTVELGRLGCARLVAADLTWNGLFLARQRCDLYEVTAPLSQQNAERLGFRDQAFTHVNCQGVIHHTPDTEACVREIARVLAPSGTASISVYHRNFFVRAWPIVRLVAKLLSRAGARLPGRGREAIFDVDDVDEIMRLADGADNPVGKAYTRGDFLTMLRPYFHIETVILHFFPARTLPFPVPHVLHRLLDRHVGFMLTVNVRKPSDRPIER